MHDGICSWIWGCCSWICLHGCFSNWETPNWSSNTLFGHDLGVPGFEKHPCLDLPSLLLGGGNKHEIFGLPPPKWLNPTNGRLQPVVSSTRSWWSGLQYPSLCWFQPEMTASLSLVNEHLINTYYCLPFTNVCCCNHSTSPRSLIIGHFPIPQE